MTPNKQATSEAEQAVESALVAYGLVGPIQLVKYRENHVFRLQNDTGDFAVRLHRAHYNDSSAIESELTLLRSLDRAGFDVPKVISTVNGDLFTSITHKGAVRHVSVLAWVPEAAPLADIETGFDGTSSLTSDDFRRCGELAGSLHNHLIQDGSITCDNRQAWDYAGLVGKHALWGDPFALDEIEPVRALLENAVAELETHLAAVGKNSENYSIIHADMTPENILVAGDKMTLIDFDDFGSGWHAFEIATLLFWFQRHPNYRHFKAAALAGYASTRPMIDDRLLSGMLLARGLTYLGWAAQRRGDDTAEFIAEQLIPQVADNAREYLATSTNFS